MRDTMAERGGPRAVLAFWRPSIAPVLRPWWGAGAVLVAVGVALGTYAVLSAGRASPLAFLSRALLTGGVLCAVVGAWKALRLDSCLVARRDGVLLLGEGGAETFVPWDRLEAVEAVPPSGHLRLLLDDGTAVPVPHRFIGAPPEALVATLHDAQRRALLGIGSLSPR